MHAFRHGMRSCLQDPVTLHLLDPSYEQQDRFQPLPERAIRNGRPRTLYVHAGRMGARPLSPTRGPSRRPQSAGPPSSTAPMGAPRRPQSAAQWRRGDGVPNAVQAHLRGRLQPPAAVGSSSKVVPGFEMSGVTAQDLQGAGILYAAEAPLLQGRPKAEAPPLPPSPQAPRRAGKQASGAPKKCKVWPTDVHRHPVVQQEEPVPPVRCDQAAA